MRIYCYRDTVLGTTIYDNPPDYKGHFSKVFGGGKRDKGKIQKKMILGVNLYFILPNRIDKGAFIRAVQRHFADQITKWNSSLEYVYSPLSWCTADESYYEAAITKHMSRHINAFAFEIGEPTHPPNWRYNGFYAGGMWHGRLNVPKGFDVGPLNILLREVLK